MAEWVTVAREGEIEPGRVKLVEVAGRRICVANSECGIHAIADECTHDGGSLDQGEVFECEIECPRHGARFDVRTGRPTMPAVIPVETFPVKVEGGEVKVEV